MRWATQALETRPRSAQGRHHWVQDFAPWSSDGLGETSRRASDRRRDRRQEGGIATYYTDLPSRRLQNFRGCCHRTPCRLHRWHSTRTCQEILNQGQFRPLPTVPGLGINTDFTRSRQHDQGAPAWRVWGGSWIPHRHRPPARREAPELFRSATEGTWTPAGD